MTGRIRKHWYENFETVGSIVAIVVGVAALFVSWDQGRVMREEVRASVWPALQVDGFASREDDGFLVGLQVHNAGVGPALVQRLTLRHRGALVPDVDALLKHMPPGADLSLQTLEGRVIAAGDQVRPFELRYRALPGMNPVEFMQWLGENWMAEVCYCSVLEQCWVSGQDRGVPVPVNDCGGERTALRISAGSNSQARDR
ncbi:MAG: hypothetical protein Kow0020_06700 [Wenzhouxiangellaceae bacterium]